MNGDISTDGSTETEQNPNYFHEVTTDGTDHVHDTRYDDDDTVYIEQPKEKEAAISITSGYDYAQVEGSNGNEERIFIEPTQIAPPAPEPTPAPEPAPVQESTEDELAEQSKQVFIKQPTPPVDPIRIDLGENVNSKDDNDNDSDNADGEDGEGSEDGEDGEDGKDTEPEKIYVPVYIPVQSPPTVIEKPTYVQSQIKPQTTYSSTDWTQTPGTKQVTNWANVDKTNYSTVRSFDSTVRSTDNQQQPAPGGIVVSTTVQPGDGSRTTTIDGQYGTQ